MNYIKSVLFFLFLPLEFFTASKKTRLLALFYLTIINFFQFDVYFYLLYPIHNSNISQASEFDILMIVFLTPTLLIFPLLIPFSLMNKHIIQIGIRIIEQKPVLPRMFGTLCFFFTLTIFVLNIYISLSHICK